MSDRRPQRERIRNLAPFQYRVGWTACAIAGDAVSTVECTEYDGGDRRRHKLFRSELYAITWTRTSQSRHYTRRGAGRRRSRVRLGRQP